MSDDPSIFGMPHESLDRLFLSSLKSQRPEKEAGPQAGLVGQPRLWIGRYKLLEKIGEGGFGVVYLAQQRAPVKRRVALKIIKPGMDSKQVIGRFESERQALAMMDHPNIAKVLDAGTTEAGRPYFVMELARGEAITKYCDDSHLTMRERLELFVPVCQAVQHAHQRGIIHRDLKPTNILVTRHDDKSIPKIIDFGIAKAMYQELTDKTVYTHFQEFIGTPVYMSPEQAQMGVLDIDTRSDIYSLGVLLYELLTGTTPFDTQEMVKTGPDEIRKIIREREPIRPSTRLSQRLAKAGKSPHLPTRHSSIATDLDWIVMKTLEKDRARRYESVSELAADVTRHLNNEAVLAGKPSTLYRIKKVWQRHQTACAAAAAVVISLIAGLAAAALGWHQAEMARRELRQRNYAAEMNTAMHALEDYNLDLAIELLNRQRPAAGEEDLRGFEWRHLWQRCQSDDLASFRDGNGFGVAFSRDGRYLALGTQGGLVIREATPPYNTVEVLEGWVMTVSFSPISDILVCAGFESVTVLDTNTWQVIDTLDNCRYPARFSPDGQWLVTRTEGGFHVWRTGTWEWENFLAVTVTGDWNMRNMLAFSPDGSLLLTAHHDDGRKFQVWEFSSLEPLDHLVPPSKYTTVGAFLPDDNHLLIGHFGGEAHVWDVARGAHIETLIQQKIWITDISIAPDGKTFATASVNGRIMIWDTATREFLTDLTGHQGNARALAISPDGRLLASASGDGTLKLWDMSVRREVRELKGAERILGYSGNEGQLVAANEHGAVLWDLVTGQSNQIPIPAMEPHTYGSDHYRPPMAFHGAHMLCLIGTDDGGVRRRNLLTNRELPKLRGFNNPVSAVAFSSDGTLVTAGAEQGAVKIWDITTEQLVSTFTIPNARLETKPISLAFSPDSRYLAVAGSKIYHALVWDIKREDWKLELSMKAPSDSIAFSPDGQLLAAARGKDVFIWDFPSGIQRPDLRGHQGTVRIVAFLPDGKTLASMDSQNRVKLWNLAAQQEVDEFSLRQGELRSMAISADGRHLSVGVDDNRIHVWTVPTFEEIERIAAEEGTGSDER